MTFAPSATARRRRTSGCEVSDQVGQTVYPCRRMSEWRADPITGDWTVVADELPLARRDFVIDGDVSPLDAPCPLCPGRERVTGPEIAAVRDGDAGPWRVRVVPNRVPALRVEAGQHETVAGLFRSRPGLGAHEVVVESPTHDATWYSMSAAELAAVLGVWRDRLADLRRDGRMACAMAVKNHGADAGARLRHPHSQVVAMPMVPPRLQAKADAGARHAAATGRCRWCDLVADEMAAGVRLVADLPGFLVVVPYAARTPFELLVLPTAHAARADALDGPTLATLGGLLKHVLDRLAVELERPAFHLVLCVAPYGVTDDLVFHWHLEIVPRVLRPGGLETASGSRINPVSPERAARVLRGAGR